MKQQRDAKGRFMPYNTPTKAQLRFLARYQPEVKSTGITQDDLENAFLDGLESSKRKKATQTNRDLLNAWKELK